VGFWVGNTTNEDESHNASGATGASPSGHKAMIDLLKKNQDGIMDKQTK
jgi:hypothetical protein